MSLTRKEILAKKKKQLDEYEISLEESTPVEDIYLLIDKIKTLLAEIDIFKHQAVSSGY